MRITRGPLEGLAGVLVRQEDSGRWMVEADTLGGVFVRAEPNAIELL